MVGIINSVINSRVKNIFLNYFRILFGFILFKATVSEITVGFYGRLAKATDLYYPGFSWAIKLFGGEFLWLYLLKLVLSLIVVAGFFTNAALLGLLILWTYLFLNDPVGWLNHQYLIILSLSLTLFFPFKEAKRNPESYSRSWTINSLKILMGIVYFYGGLSKMSYDWINGYPLYLWIEKKNVLPVMKEIFSLIDPKVLAISCAWGSMILDFFAPVFLNIKRTRIYWLFLLIIFHILNEAQFKIGIFPTFSIAMSCLYLIPIEKSIVEKMSMKEFFHRPIDLFLIIFFLIQALVPLKRFIYPYDSIWTGESARFGWRMLASDKVGTISFFTKNKKTGETRRLELKEGESPSDFIFYPNHIIQRARTIKLMALLDGQDVSVHAEAYLSYNGRKAQQFIDPFVDLSEQDLKIIGRFDWIKPLVVPLSRQK